ncbi:MAG: hypothetical protein MJE77_34110 [Proteobacteria bacterium]|nr:hypothetical protein [Pseudomonadota bacterium]
MALPQELVPPDVATSAPDGVVAISNDESFQQDLESATSQSERWSVATAFRATDRFVSSLDDIPNGKELEAIANDYRSRSFADEETSVRRPQASMH